MLPMKDINKDMNKHIVDSSNVVEAKVTSPLLDNHGKEIRIVDGMLDLRDHYRDDMYAMLEKRIRNDSHLGPNKVMIPVGWRLVSTEEYDKINEPEWWIDTPYEPYILIGKFRVVVSMMIIFPSVALYLIDIIPDEYRIAAKETQSTTGAG